MFILITSLIIACLLPYVARFPVMLSMIKLKDGYNNRYPRRQQSELEGFGARALGAHLNSFESLIVFSAAVLLAIATNHVTKEIELLAMIHVVARVLFILAYWYNQATLRSIVWLVGFVCSISILFKCI
jgi:uncharacterized MAPEG superfamily protein